MRNGVLFVLVLILGPILLAAGDKEETKKTDTMYSVNIAPAGDAPLKIETTTTEDGTEIVTVMGRIYAWSHRLDEKSGRLLLLELQADNAVIWREQGPPAQEPAIALQAMGQQDISSIYMNGNVVITEGQRTIRADQIYYDFQDKKALAINALLKSFDAARGIPIYVRAEKLRQVAEDKFIADNINLTTSEFYLPQISLNASNITITDTSPVDEQDEEGASDSSFDAQMQDVRFNMYDKTIFYWPSMRSNLQRPDTPLKGARTSYDNTWGVSVETDWHLARLLGLQEPKGTRSVLSADYYSKRGPGGGIEIDYARENNFGRISSYIIDDSGKDRLGRNRKDLEPPNELRGRFRWQHRHFLPYEWQLTTEISYLSDENFLEQYYRGEFYTGKEQETLVHLKRIEDNWGLSILGKTRINHFVSEVEELPSAQFHVTGQSLFDDKFTFYSENQIGRFRTPNWFTFISTRNELDLPLTIGRSKIVPFAAGTVGYESGSGFHTNINGLTVLGEDEIWVAETGVRISPQPYWKVYPNVQSRLQDLDQLRHIIKPELTAVAYTENNPVVEQRDTLNVGISQRLQTWRGPADKRRVVDWMRLDLDVTWVTDSGTSSAGPDRFIWNKPFIPLADRSDTNMFGPRRNYIGADFLWRLSDTTAILSDMNFDMQSGVVQQANVGFSHARWPDLSYYIGSRYLKRFNNGFGEKGSNAFTFAATYVLDPRYTVVFSQQFDFDYGANIQSEITLIRKYHRLYFSLTFSVDESMDQHSIVFSIWPEGVPELAIGLRRYMGLDSGYH